MSWASSLLLFAQNVRELETPVSQGVCVTENVFGQERRRVASRTHCRYLPLPEQTPPEQLRVRPDGKAGGNGVDTERGRSSEHLALSVTSDMQLLREGHWMHRWHTVFISNDALFVGFCLDLTVTGYSCWEKGIEYVEVAAVCPLLWLHFTYSLTDVTFEVNVFPSAASLAWWDCWKDLCKSKNTLQKRLDEDMS